jgi:hypothetical protein
MMKTYLRAHTGKLLALIGLGLLLLGCEDEATDLSVGNDWAHLTGVVKYAENLAPVEGAFVRTQSHLESTLTDSAGFYDLAIELPDGTQEIVILEVYKEGYLAFDMDAVISAGQTTPLPVITMERYLDSTITDTTISGSGSAVSMVLISLSPETLSVTGTGGTSISQIICEARDANGNAVDSLHAVQVNFELEVDPGGGAYVFPVSAVTDDDGRVATTFYAGSQAGIAIIKAEFTEGGVFIVLPDISIYQTGDPASIALLDLQYDSIAVKGTGANEVTTMSFEVRDAGGSPLTLAQSVQVNFALLGQTGGGEYLYPTSAITDALGQVSTSLNSGTVAGAVQVLAYLEQDSSVVCTPVPVAIHSGLPDQEHFAVVPQYLNFPGFNFYGVIDSMYALVGDIYANPVPLGTAVYFTTDAGIIEGSSSTDANGFARVRLYSGPPSPPPSFPFGAITAQTVGEGGQIITDQTLVLFSGITQIYAIDPDGFNITNGGSQVFTYRVSDQNGYPLAHGTEIQVEPTAGAVLGDVGVIFPDTQSQSWTYFTFVLFDSDAEEVDPAVLAAVSITVTSPNGNGTVIIQGTLD